MLNAVGVPQKILLLGGTSEIGLATVSYTHLTLPTKLL